MLNHACGTGQHSHSERGLDLYETPPEAVKALLKTGEALHHRIWEPAAGRGAIVRVLREHGYEVMTGDVFDYGGLDYVGDFLEQGAPAEYDTIVTNPPFKIAHQFIKHALNLRIRRVFMLLRLTFYESDKRTDILENAGLARIYSFRNRLPMMHRDGWLGNKVNSSIAFAWFVWQLGYTGDTTIHRISWSRE